MESLKNLKKSILFYGFSDKAIEEYLKNVSYQIKIFEKDQVIIREGDDINSLGIILDGHTQVTRNLTFEKDITISRLGPGQSIAEAAVFSKKAKYPATVTSLDRCAIFFLNISSLENRLRSDFSFSENIIRMLADRIILLNETINLFSFSTIREKLSYFLLSESKKNSSSMFSIQYTRKSLADKLNIPRPSLSRVLSHMRDEGLIDFHKNSFKITDIIELTNVIC